MRLESVLLNPARLADGVRGHCDKLETAKRLFAERFGADLGRVNADYAFVGDSPNDAPMFAFFENSIGVGNVRRFEGRLEAAPRYVTRAPAGAGFAELAAHLLGERRPGYSPERPRRGRKGA